MAITIAACRLSCAPPLFPPPFVLTKFRFREFQVRGSYLYNFSQLYLRWCGCWWTAEGKGKGSSNCDLTFIISIGLFKYVLALWFYPITSRTFVLYFSELCLIVLFIEEDRTWYYELCECSIVYFVFLHFPGLLSGQNLLPQLENLSINEVILWGSFLFGDF